MRGRAGGDLPELRALLAAVLAEVRALRADLARRGGTGPRATVDAAALVAAIARVVEGRAFSAGELLQHTAVDPELAASLEALGLRSTRALGAALRGVRDQVIDGRRVTAIGRDAAGMVWAVVYVADRHTGSSVAALGPT
ncbi:MAG: hypothetical protein KBA95_13235 [Acidobacteria bacterium]|nr:hypothetical protein [Acidobacteriota bacterium]